MSRWRVRHSRQILFALLAWCLLWLTLRQVGWLAIWGVLHQLAWRQLGVWALLNGLVMVTFTLRWWVLLCALGHSLSPFVLFHYRLIAFGVTYFTPGPQFGGEPLQVYLVARQHRVPTADAIAAVTMDKGIELLLNFGFLLVGVLLMLQAGWLPQALGYQSLFYGLLLLALPVGLWVALWQGRHPLSAFVRYSRHWLARWRRPDQFLRKLEQPLQVSEQQTHRLLRQHPRAVLRAFLLTLLGWLLMVVEFTYAAHALGLPLTITQSVAAMVAARVAFLLPLPAGVGALESSLALALPLLGFAAADGVALSLLIRGRDVLFAGIGLWLGQRALRQLTPVLQRSYTHEPT